MNIEVDNLNLRALMDIYKAIVSCTEAGEDLRNYILDKMPSELTLRVSYDKESFLDLYAEGYTIDKICEYMFEDSSCIKCSDYDNR